MTEAIVVGSGPNGLAAALVLADAGVRVRVLEAAERLGGGTRTSELTLPGLLHDECSAAHPLAVENPFARAFDLAADGLRWVWPEVQYSHPLDGGRGAAAHRSLAATADGLGVDGRAWRRVFGPLTRAFAAITEDFLRPMLHVPRHPVPLSVFGAWSALPATVLGRVFATEQGRALWAGVAGHAFRPLHAPMSSAIGVALGTAAHRFGWPVAAGGSQAIADALVAAGRRRGVAYETGRSVRALAEVDGADLVLLDLAPAAVAGLAGDRLPPRVSRALRRFRHGPAAFKVEFAVEGGVPWSHEPSRRAGTVHVGGSLPEIAAAEREVNRGRMPERPFMLVCQQSVADPSRADGDRHPLYAYAHVPHGWTGDATSAVEAQIERFAPGFRDRVLARHVRGPAAMQAHNPNYVGGDIATGANDPLQLVLRPRPTLHPYATGVPGVFLCSAATPPGAGAHGMCGFNAARAALASLDR
jgi:phytoene dehydrogenase-like protein